ncbi:helix-turn-helix domain-containing protein [Streptomyces sp. NPDC057375]|uniref:helix-turn-helix domain-containing protein n=1 Tax=Streptomyces sp. NPDC057375 TaxID=3346109 RepID=UPI003644A3F4
MPKFDEPESIGNEVVMGEVVAADAVPVQGRAEMVVVLAQQGMGRNEISRRTGISTASVSRIAEANGISFDGSRVEVALKARIAELKQAQAGIALGLHEDIAVARMLLRTARTHRDYAFAAKAIGDLTQAAQRMTPEITSQEEAEEVKEALIDLRFQAGLMRDGFEAKYGVPMDSAEGIEIFNKMRQEAKQDD